MPFMLRTPSVVVNLNNYADYRRIKSLFKNYMPYSTRSLSNTDIYNSLYQEKLKRYTILTQDACFNMNLLYSYSQDVSNI